MMVKDWKPRYDHIHAIFFWFFRYGKAINHQIKCLETWGTSKPAVDSQFSEDESWIPCKNADCVWKAAAPTCGTSTGHRNYHHSPIDFTDGHLRNAGPNLAYFFSFCSSCRNCSCFSLLLLLSQPFLPFALPALLALTFSFLPYSSCLRKEVSTIIT